MNASAGERPNPVGHRRREPVFQSGDVTVVALDDTDAPELQHLFEQCGDYFELVFGVPPGPAEVQSGFVALPEGSTYEDKLLLGVFDDNEKLVGHIDAVRDYPAPGVWTVGLLLLTPTARDRGVGRGLIRELSSWIAASGGRDLRVGVVEWNERALAFFESAGFSIKERRPGVQSGLKEGTVVVLARPVGGD